MILFKSFKLIKDLYLKIKKLGFNIFFKIFNCLLLFIPKNFKNFNQKVKIIFFSFNFDLNDDISKIRLILKSFLSLNNSKLEYNEKRDLFFFVLNVCKINIDDSFLNRYFYVISDKDRASSKQIDLIKIVKNYNDNDFHSLVMLKKISYALGLYKLSFYLRLFLERKVLKSNSQNKQDLIYKFNVSLFLNNEKVFKSTSEKLDKNFFLNRSCQVFNPKDCYSFFFQNKNFSANKYLNTSDLQYKEIIENKTVAIIGPSNSLLNQKDQIDNFDIVIRMNQEEPLEKSFADFIGTKMDINYFGGGLIHNRKEKVFDFINESKIKFVCFKNDKTVEDYNLPNVKARQWFEFPWSFECSHMMIQNILLDLLCFNPKKIKLFNIDFYLGKKKYLSNKYKLGVYSRSPVFDLHDPYVNYKVVKFLYEKGIIEVDANIEKILKYSNRYYVKILEEVNKDTAFNLIY